MKVKQVTDASFKKYGKILTGIDFSEIYNVLEKIKYPETVEYAASFGPLEEPDFRQKISNLDFLAVSLMTICTILHYGSKKRKLYEHIVCFFVTSAPVYLLHPLEMYTQIFVRTQLKLF